MDEALSRIKDPAVVVALVAIVWVLLDVKRQLSALWRHRDECVTWRAYHDGRTRARGENDD
jgi:hypothetical protein